MILAVKTKKFLQFLQHGPLLSTVISKPERQSVHESVRGFRRDASRGLEASRVLCGGYNRQWGAWVLTGSQVSAVMRCSSPFAVRFFGAACMSAVGGCFLVYQKTPLFTVLRLPSPLPNVALWNVKLVSYHTAFLFFKLKVHLSFKICAV